MSNYKFNIDVDDDEQRTTLSMSKYQTKSQKDVCQDDVLQYYNPTSIEIPTDYIDMLSCIKDIIKDPEALKEPWSLLEYLDKTRFEQSEKYIPIKLVDEKELPKIDAESLNSKKISPDLLGAYFSCYEQNKPIILLCPSRILIVAKLCNIKAKLLCKKVIIHEFAHALMDSTNWYCEKDFAPQEKNQCQKITSDARRFMEESLANMLTLQYFTEIAENAKKNAENAVKSKNEDLKNAANDLEHDAKEKADEAEKVKEFIDNHQPHIYQFGITQFELKTNWKEWRDYKANKTSDFWSYWAGLFASKMIV